MHYKFSLHAKEQLINRRIDKNLAETVLDNPDRILKRDECLSIFQKSIKEGNRTYLYRVFVNTCKDPKLIITVYKTSKLKKYEN